MSRFWKRLRPSSRMGSRTLARRDWGSSSSMGEPLTLRTPFPLRTDATATEFFFLPKHWVSWPLVSDIWWQIIIIFNCFNQLPINNPPTQPALQQILVVWIGYAFDCYLLLQGIIAMKQQAQVGKEKRLVKILAISDTHYQHEKIDISKWPQADIFVHAGDFTITSTRQELHNFRQFLGRLPYKHKIVVAGNHDFGLEPTVEMYHSLCESWEVPKNEWVNPQEEIKKLQSVCTYLCHDFVEVQGVKIFGTPHVWVGYDHAFKTANMSNQQVWSKMPQKVDVLVTHMPPFGILDSTAVQHTGCKRLLASVNKIQPKVHIFGHIHESHGMSAAGSTSFFNVSALDEHYNPKHGPTLINLWV